MQVKRERFQLASSLPAPADLSPERNAAIRRIVEEDARLLNDEIEWWVCHLVRTLSASELVRQTVTGAVAGVKRLLGSEEYLPEVRKYVLLMEDEHRRLVHRLIGALTGASVFAHSFLSKDRVDHVKHEQTRITLRLAVDWWQSPLRIVREELDGVRPVFTFGKAVGLTFGGHSVVVQCAQFTRLGALLADTVVETAFQADWKQASALLGVAYVALLRRHLDAAAIHTLNGCSFEAGYLDGG